MKLTEKQRRFADEYIRLGEITQAAINAGYSSKTAHSMGSENLKKPIIKSYIDKRLNDLRKESIAEQDEVLQYLTSVMRGEETEQTLRGVGEGAQTISDIEVDAAKRIKAAELLGKRYGIWTDKQEIDVNGAVTFVDDIGDEDET
ncbi:terminase small subunit [Virgibacillus salexigens]|uniref:terminase small subunit n=1 Tax=Virgibacillus salexigens TaxID=61016 RepID=UPI00190A5C8E|nr:terminase small subunit [Virgibacillus salexigens]